MTKDRSPRVIGIIEGGGTGVELAHVFKDIVSGIISQTDQEPIEFFSFKDEYGYCPHSFWELKNDYYSKSYTEVRAIIDKEVNDIIAWDNILIQKNFIGNFRTAINAETLYILREKVKSIKVVPISITKAGKTKNILFIRDQIQGFYTNDSLEVGDEKLTIHCSYSLKNFKMIIEFLQHFEKKAQIVPEHVVFIYKYHIVGIELQRMIDSAMSQSGYGGSYKILQPDSGIHYLFHDLFRDDTEDTVAVICGNEVGDVLLEAIIHHFNLGTKETVYTINHILGKKNLEALQTMHGSADDVAGKDLVNPIATIKAAAHALERWIGVEGAQARIDTILDHAVKTRNCTPDLGGTKQTSQVVRYVLENW